jgi:flagellar P-ring protein precursor FlgI
VYEFPSRNIATAVIPHTTIAANEDRAPLVRMREGATVGDLVAALNAIHLSTLDVIAVLQSVKAAGALDGELLIQ